MIVRDARAMEDDTWQKAPQATSRHLWLIENEAWKPSSGDARIAECRKVEEYIRKIKMDYKGIDVT